ncbi:hypothetical protein MMC21_006239 [Puttea exsequens]|nr:hypothetical protein [Puttea exsequens]
MTERKRLHISPLNAELLHMIIHPPLLDKASNISFHTIDTFPEKNYGFVDLPLMDAEKLKKKLNGSVLRGSKMRVEEARPKMVDVEREDAGSEQQTKVKNSKKGKARADGVLGGHELRDRKVKRGWTEPSAGESKATRKSKNKEGKKRKRNDDSLTGEAECLFKTTIPPNVVEPQDDKGKKRKRKGPNREAVVHEFTNNTKHPNFIRENPTCKDHKTTTEYIEGTGWVDENGNTVEAEPKTHRRKAKAKKEDQQPQLETKPRSRRSSRLEAPKLAKPSRPQTVQEEAAEDETSSSGTSSSAESESEREAAPSASRSKAKAGKGSQKEQKGGLSINLTAGDDSDVERVSRLSITRSSATPPPSQSQLPESAPVQASTEVHPLETLFKRPKIAASASHTPKKPPNLEVSTSFSFFDQEGDENGAQGSNMPHTPFTQQDIRHRRERSAAPTPDTAMPGKTFADAWEGTSDISEEDEEEDVRMNDTPNGDATARSGEEKPESEFSKWFWEHRGENNRAWKRRRREAAKEKRQKENKELRG